MTHHGDLLRIGLFGGTFNPIHRCHLVVAAQARDRLSLDRVLFIPSGDPPHKPPGTLAPAHHRVEMVRRAIAAEPTFLVSEVEVRRPALSYSIDTVHALGAEFGAGTGLFFLVGLDAFLQFPSWRQAPELLKLCHFVVMSRPGAAFRSLSDLALLPRIPIASLAALDAGQLGRLDLPIPGGTLLILLALPPCDASSSAIRRRIRQRLNASALLPASVESYIIQSGLYQEETDRTGV